jgi:hypothetical protein
MRSGKKIYENDITNCAGVKCGAFRSPLLNNNNNRMIMIIVTNFSQCRGLKGSGGVISE